MKINRKKDFIKMTPQELIEYKQYLLRWQKWALEEIEVFSQMYSKTLAEMNHRLEEMQWQMAKIQCNKERFNEDNLFESEVTSSDRADFNLH